MAANSNSSQLHHPSPSTRQVEADSKKKTFKASQAYTERVQKLRVEYWLHIEQFDPDDLVFIDETAVTIAMVLLYARALRGHRAYGEKPQRRGSSVTLIGAMALRGMIASLSFEGAVNGDIFLCFIKEVLCSQLWPGAVVVMDNLSSHKVAGVREALEEVGARLVYLSSYSPEFNPIENCWSKLKAHLRKMAARSREALDEAISEGLNMVSLSDIRNWFAHGCYCTASI